ncbi:ATP-dependent Clp protease adaptor ClpS, partial [Cutibacterium acnes]
MSVATAEPMTHRLVGQESTWTTVVWYDPVNLMDYVTMVFMRYFGYPRERAT